MSIAAWQDDFQRANAQKRANVVCMKWGTQYEPWWVNRLYGMVARNTSWNVRFVCFTDDAAGIRSEVECQPMPEVRFDPKLGKFWPKLGLMQSGLGGLEGMTLFLDLDVVVLESLDPFFSHEGRFCIIREWKDPHLGYGNSSVVRFFIGRESAVLDRFYATAPEEIVSRYAAKEQNFLTKAVDEVTFWPEDWCAPFQRASLPKNRLVRFFTTPIKPPGAKILVFYGAITPASAMRGEHEDTKRRKASRLKPTQRRFRPARWIGDYWKE